MARCRSAVAYRQTVEPETSWHAFRRTPQSARAAVDCGAFVGPIAVELVWIASAANEQNAGPAPVLRSLRLHAVRPVFASWAWRVLVGFREKRLLHRSPFRSAAVKVLRTMAIINSVCRCRSAATLNGCFCGWLFRRKPESLDARERR